MNKLLEEFIKLYSKESGSALDLGAGNFADVDALIKRGWIAEGVDLKTGVDLERVYISPSGKYDLVVSNFVIHKLKNKNNFLETIIANLKSGGWLFILTFDKADEISDSELDAKFFIQYLKDDFAEIKTETIDQFDNDPGHNHFHKILKVIARKK